MEYAADLKPADLLPLLSWSCHLDSQQQCTFLGIVIQPVTQDTDKYREIILLIGLKPQEAAVVLEEKGGDPSHTVPGRKMPSSLGSASPVDDHQEPRSGQRAPQEYSDQVLTFSPMKAFQLPPHHEWDCAIMLKEGAVPPRCRIYPVSLEEERIMGQHIKDVLQQGYIYPSTSPALASIFFVKKKDGGLRPCVDYWGFNELLIPYTYPLPLVPNALD
ncbi:hypothetical protein P4O66_001091 [Electrophorus voltai]|uniref:Uncharacterized protein n=1 Tax=Electrophorus voltai TaxID=2609070 RepID=A0AAD8ZCT1_9TELE|nr:hypothetical protein P4O66_001091 [Electrophorus voltai]